MCDMKPQEIVISYRRNQGERLFPLVQDMGYFVADRLSMLLERVQERQVEHENDALLVKVPAGEEFSAIYHLARAGDKCGVLSVEPNWLFHTVSLGPLTRFSLDSSTHNHYANLLNLNAAHADGVTGKGARVAILDTGVEGASRLSAWGVNFLNSSTNAEDDEGHGTAVAGIISEVAPDAEIIPIKIANYVRQSDLWLLLAGLFAAKARKPDIINISMAFGLGKPCSRCGRISGPGVRSEVLSQAIEELAAANVSIVASAGNEGKHELSYPARFKNVIPIVSVNAIGSRSGFSNWSLGGDFYLAPGGDGLPKKRPTEVVGTNPRTGATHAGTSFAAAYASGTLALYREMHGASFAAIALDDADRNRRLIAYH